VLDTNPLPAAPRLISLFEIFAAEAAAEQRRLREEKAVREREEELSALLRSAMDAVVVLDAGGGIIRVNRGRRTAVRVHLRRSPWRKPSRFSPAESGVQFNTFVKGAGNAIGRQPPIVDPPQFFRYSVG
jgi:hypothetical protein